MCPVPADALSRGSRWLQILSVGKEKAGGGTRGWLDVSWGKTFSQSLYNTPVTALWVQVMDLGIVDRSRSCLEGSERAVITFSSMAWSLIEPGGDTGDAWRYGVATGPHRQPQMSPHPCARARLVLLRLHPALMDGQGETSALQKVHHSATA